MTRYRLVTLIAASAAAVSLTALGCSSESPSPTTGQPGQTSSPTAANPSADRTPFTLQKADDPVAQALAGVGVECYPGWQEPIQMVVCHAKGRGQETRIYYQVDGNGFVDGDITSVAGSQERWAPPLAEAAKAVATALAPRNADVVAQVAGEASAEGKEVGTAWGTFTAVGGGGGGTVTVTRKGAKRTTIDKVAWTGTADAAATALKDAGYACEGDKDITCTANGDEVKFVAGVGGLNYVVAKVGSGALSPTSTVVADLPLALRALAGEQAGWRIGDVAAQLADGTAHEVVVDGYTLELDGGSVFVKPAEWRGLR